MKRTESSIQQECYIWFNNKYCLKHHTEKCVMFSVPNEVAMAIRSVLIGLGLNNSIVDKAISIIIKKINNTGFMAGVSDTIVLMPGRCIFIEFKTDIGIQSQDQKEFEKTLNNIGHEYHICRSIDEFKEIIQPRI